MCRRWCKLWAHETGEYNCGCMWKKGRVRRMEETILICENSMAGVLTAVYQAYAWKLSPDNTKLQIGEADLCLFATYRTVESDQVLAEKVASTVKRRFGMDAWESISFALASEADDRGQAVYQTIALGLSGKVRGPLMGCLASDAVHRVFELSRSVHREVCRMTEFVRFRELEGNVLFSRIEPGADVTALIMPHFADRFPLENFVIADTRRKIAGVHPAGRDWFLIQIDERDSIQMEQMRCLETDEEEEIAFLFCRFFNSIAITERRNDKLQKQLMPLKYRRFLTEYENIQSY